MEPTAMDAAPRMVPAVALILEHLEAEGVGYIFGVPGRTIIPLYEAMHDRGTIKPVLAKHEEGAAFMADAYARVSGRIGVCCATTGPGATNALTGIAVAHADHVPVLLLTAQVRTDQFGRGAFQESSPDGSVDIVSLYRPVTKWSTMIHHPDGTGRTIRTALRLARSGRPGPVHVSLPLDYITRPVRHEDVPRERRALSSRTFDRAAVREAASRLLAARRPAVLAGHGVNLARAWRPLRELAERFRIPVATTFKAKGAFPEDHPLSLGVFCSSGDPWTRDYVAGPATDLLLVVGTGLGEISSCGWDRRLGGSKSLLQSDVDPSEIGRNFPVDVALAGDAAAVLTELRFEMERRSRNGPGRAFPERPEPAADALPESEAARAGPLRARDVLAELRRVLPRDAIVFVDNGSIRTWAGRYFPVCQEGCFFVNMGLASMGYAVAGSVGGKLAAPGRIVVALVGDAAFAMNGMEVHTAIEHDAPVVWLVINNGGHGMVYHGENALYGGKFHSGVFRTRLDVMGLAKAMGAASFAVEEPGDLTDVLRLALRRRKACVIDVRADLGEPPPMNAGPESSRGEPKGAAAGPRSADADRGLAERRRAAAGASP